MSIKGVSCFSVVKGSGLPAYMCVWGCYDFFFFDFDFFDFGGILAPNKRGFCECVCMYMYAYTNDEVCMCVS